MEDNTAIREVVEAAFESAGFSRYTTHAFRDTLVQLSYELCKTSEHLNPDISRDCVTRTRIKL